MGGHELDSSDSVYGKATGFFEESNGKLGLLRGDDDNSLP